MTNTTERRLITGCANASSSARSVTFPRADLEAPFPVATTPNAVEHMQHMTAPIARRNHLVHALGMQHGADAIAVAREQPRQHRHELGRQHALAHSARAEVDRAREIDQKPGRHLAILLELAHVRRRQPRRHVPVDIAHVVMQLVLAQVGEIQTEAAEQCSVIALQQTSRASAAPSTRAAATGARRRSGARGARHRRQTDGRRRRARATAPATACLGARRHANMALERRFRRLDGLQHAHDQRVGGAVRRTTPRSSAPAGAAAHRARGRSHPRAARRRAPRRKASARAPSIRLIVARGLAPKVR